jgi:hypothetical protein
MRSQMTTQVNLSPPVRQLSLVFLMFVCSSSAVADESTPPAKPEAPTYTAAPAVPLSAEQRAALAAKRAATVTPARAAAITPTKRSSFSFTGGPAGESSLKSLPSPNPTAAVDADGPEAFVRAQGRDVAAQAGVLKTVDGHDEMANPVRVTQKVVARTAARRAATEASKRSTRQRGAR